MHFTIKKSIMEKVTKVSAHKAEKSVKLQLSELKKEVGQLKKKLTEPRMITLTIHRDRVFEHVKRLCQMPGVTSR